VGKTASEESIWGKDTQKLEQRGVFVQGTESTMKRVGKRYGIKSKIGPQTQRKVKA